MAIQKNKVYTSNNSPEPLYEMPTPKESIPNVPYGPHPGPGPHPHPGPEPAPMHLYNSFDEAVDAVNDVHLRPGEVHTEFYKTGKDYHCVVGIGNVKPNTKHLILTDSGNLSIVDQFKEIQNQLTTFNTEFTVYKQQVNLQIENIISQIGSIETIVHQQGVKINQLESSLDESLEQIRQMIVQLNEFKQEVNEQIQVIDSKIDNNTEDIQELKQQNIEMNTSISLLQQHVRNTDVSVNNNTNAIRALQQQATSVNASINALQQHDRNIDASIIDLRNTVISLEPIPDSSIPPLFHDDIYTVNLCCYTSGGHIEIRDHYNEGRVADCTPHNEYKTYVNGDSVDLVAVTNIGYKFIGWCKNADIEHIIPDVSVHVVFKNNDINVKGKVVNIPTEPELVENGYTALFQKLHTITLDIDTHVVGSSSEPVYTNDRIKVVINGKECTQMPYYFEPDSSVLLLPIPDTGHDFNYMTVNFKEQKYYDQYYNAECDEDLFVFANFTEYWSKVTVDADPANHARIESEHGIGGSYIYGEEIDITGVAEPGYEFRNWMPAPNSSMTIDQLERDIIEGDVNTASIVLKVNKDIRNYELTGYFVEV